MSSNERVEVIDVHLSVKTLWICHNSSERAYENYDQLSIPSLCKYRSNRLSTKSTVSSNQVALKELIGLSTFQMPSTMTPWLAIRVKTFEYASEGISPVD